MSFTRHTYHDQELGLDSLSLEEDRNYRIASHCVQNTPISALMPEVLSIIFEMAFEFTGDERVPVILSLVSQTWRDVAINNPLLWNRFTISLPFNIGAIAVNLKRSKESPLEIRILVPYLDVQVFENLGLSLPSTEECLDLSRELSGAYHRCRRLHIEGKFADTPEMVQVVIAPLTKLSMPYLEEITLNGEDLGNDEADASRITQIFTDAPKLRDVRLGGYGLIHFRPPTSHITTLHLVAPSQCYPYDLFVSLRLPSRISTLPDISGHLRRLSLQTRSRSLTCWLMQCSKAGVPIHNGGYVCSLRASSTTFRTKSSRTCHCSSDI